MKQRHGFTLTELLVVIAVIAVLASILLPTLARSKRRAQAVFCLNNTKQLTLAWMTYADDHEGRLAYNLGASSTTLLSGSTPMAMNWVDNVLNWELDPDNTNTAKLVDTGLGPYTSKAANIYHCPADDVLSLRQEAAGWSERVRSYSMNAMIGNAGPFSPGAFNVSNTNYVQFFNISTITRPAQIFVFLDEHPDSIDDGYFVNQAEIPEWHDLPASYHDGGASISFVDGHAEIHHWRYARTRPASLPGAAHLPIQIPANERDDFNWLTSRMSVERYGDHAAN